MKCSKVSVRVGRTVSVQKYEFLRLDIEMDVKLTDDSDIKEVITRTRKALRTQLVKGLEDELDFWKNYKKPSI